MAERKGKSVSSIQITASGLRIDIDLDVLRFVFDNNPEHMGEYKITDISAMERYVFNNLLHEVDACPETGLSGFDRLLDKMLTEAIEGAVDWIEYKELEDE